ncbi:MAG: hypothetical protein KGH58_01065 [Candidatus Micrarchaeota archaeon]|nr:hypothetical protein [Candidatus Micrarchaeota archaeon]
MHGSGSGKAQSAMEYLMTYGWAILVIAVALTILYQIGIFGGGSNLLSTSCIANTGYLCSGLQLNTTGNLIVQFAQSTGQTITLTGISCTKNLSSPVSVQSIQQTPLAPGQKTSLTFGCPLSSNALGTKFSGYLWVQYNSQTQNGNMAELGSVTAVASSSQPVSASTAFAATCGGTLTVVNGNDVCTFTSSGTFTVTGSSGSVAVLVVGGGGGGGWTEGPYSGGGGAGGVIENDNFAVTPQAYPVTVGAGGPAGTGFQTPQYSDGGNSVFNSITAIGGGGGAYGYCCTYGVGSGASGGSGGGGGSINEGSGGGNGGSGTAGQGNNGGYGGSPGGGGGGGAGGVGGPGASGNGGAGQASSISGSLNYYGGGGAGGPAGSGGQGGGGNGNGQSGVNGKGGGGGGDSNGGSGVVIIAWNALGNGAP